MTFRVIAQDEDEYGCTSWVRCEDCGGVERVDDHREPDDAEFAAFHMHTHIVIDEESSK